MIDMLQDAIEKECASFYIIDNAKQLVDDVVIVLLLGEEICKERKILEDCLQNVMKVKPKEFQVLELKKAEDFKSLEAHFEEIKTFYAAKNGMILNLNLSVIFMMHDTIFFDLDIEKAIQNLKNSLWIMSGSGFQWDNISYYGILDKITTKHKNTYMDYRNVFSFLTKSYKEKCCYIVYHPEITLLFDKVLNLRAIAMRILLDIEKIAKDNINLETIEGYPWFSLRLCEQRLPEQWVCSTLKKMIENQWINSADLEDSLIQEEYNRQKEKIKKCLWEQIQLKIKEILQIEEKAVQYLPLYYRKNEIMVTKQEEIPKFFGIFRKKEQKLEKKEEIELKLFQKNQVETFFKQNYQKPDTFFKEKETFFRNILKECTKIIGEEALVAETFLEIFQVVIEEIALIDWIEEPKQEGQTILDYAAFRFRQQKAKCQEELFESILEELRETLKDSSSKNPVRKIVREILSYYTQILKGLENLLYSRYGGENPFIAEKTKVFEANLLLEPNELCKEINRHILKESIKAIIEQINWKSITEFLIASKEKIASRNGITGDVYKPGVSAGSPMYYYFTSKKVEGNLPIVGMEVILEPIFSEHTLQLLSTTLFSSPVCLTDYYPECAKENGK